MTGLNLRNKYPGSYNGHEWDETLSRYGFPVYSSTSEAIAANGTLAGLVVTCGPGRALCFGFSDNHVAICEGYDPVS